MSPQLKKMGVKDIEITLPKANSQMHKNASMSSYFAVVAHLYEKFSIPLLTLFLLPVVFLKFKILQLVASLRVLLPD